MNWYLLVKWYNGHIVTENVFVTEEYKDELVDILCDEIELNEIESFLIELVEANTNVYLS